jgi:superfamily I DNA and/or RNA helicase
MHPDLSDFPNHHTYKGRLVDAEDCRSLDLDPIYSEGLRTWAMAKLPEGANLPDDISRRTGVNVADGQMEINDSTQSKFNRKYAEVVKGILNALFAEAPYPDFDIIVLTPYTAQRALYEPIITDLHILTGLPFEMLPRSSYLICHWVD